MRALLKLVIAVIIVLSVAGGVRYWAESWRLWQIEADPLASWQPSLAHTEARHEEGVSLITITPSGTASLRRDLTFHNAEDAALAEKEANALAHGAGWAASGVEGSYNKEIADIHACLHIDRIDSVLWVTLVG